MRTKFIVSAVAGGLLFSACSIAADVSPTGGSQVHRDKDGVVSVEIELRIINVTKNEEGELRITATGVLEDKVVGFALTVPNRWDVHPLSRPGNTMHQFVSTLIRIGEPSDALDAALRKFFRLKKSETIFKPSGYPAVTLANREQLDRSKVEIGYGDNGADGGVTWSNNVVILDLPNKTIRLTVREPFL